MHNNSDCHILNASLDAILMNLSLKYLIDVGIFNFPVHRQPITIACFFRGPSSIILAFTWTLFSIFDSLLRLLISLRSFPSLRPRLSEENNDPDLTSLKPLRTPRRLWRWAGPDKEQYDTGTGSSLRLQTFPKISVRLSGTPKALLTALQGGAVMLS